MCFVDADGSYVFTLGIDACEPQEHRVNCPLILKVGNQNINVLETVNCTRSNGMYFHEHRLRPLDTSDLDLVTHAVQRYCSKLQTLQENPASGENEGIVALSSISVESSKPQPATDSADPRPGTSSHSSPAESSQVRSQLRVQSPRARAVSRPSPYPDTSSIQQRRAPLSQSQSSTDSTNTLSSMLSHSSSAAFQPIALPSTSGSRITQPDQKTIEPELKRKVIDYCLEHHEGKTCYHAFTQLQKAFNEEMVVLEYMPSRTTLENILKEAQHIRIEQTSSDRISKTIARDPSLAAPPLSNSSAAGPLLPTLGFTAPREGQRYLTTEAKQTLLNYCLENHVGKSCYQAFEHLKKAYDKGEITLDHIPSRTGLENILKQTGYLRLEQNHRGRSVYIIAATQVQEEQPPQSMLMD